MHKINATRELKVSVLETAWLYPIPIAVSPGATNFNSRDRIIFVTSSVVKHQLHLHIIIELQVLTKY